MDNFSVIPDGEFGGKGWVLLSGGSSSSSSSKP